MEPRSQYWYSQLHFNSTGFVLKFPFHVLSSFLTASILICSINPTVWNQSSIPSAIFSPLHMISETQHRVPPQPYVASFLSSYPALAWGSGLPCHPAAPHHLQFSSVTQSCPTLCYPVDGSIPGLLVHHQLPEFTHTHVHWAGDAIQLSHPLLSPSPPAFNLSQHQGLFKWVSSSHQVAKVLEFQLQHQSFQWIFRIDFHYDGLVGSPCSPRDARESSPTSQFKSINSSVLSFLYSPTLTSIHDYCKNHSLD